MCKKIRQLIRHRAGPGARFGKRRDGGRRQAALYWRCQQPPHGEVVDKWWGRHEAKRVADGFAAELVALKTYGQALALVRVRRDHAALRETLALPSDALKQALAVLAATRKDLDAVRTALARL